MYDANLPESIRDVLESVSLVTGLSFNFGTPLECQGLYGFLPLSQMGAGLRLWLSNLEKAEEQRRGAAAAPGAALPPPCFPLPETHAPPSTQNPS